MRNCAARSIDWPQARRGPTSSSRPRTTRSSASTRAGSSSAGTRRPTTTFGWTQAEALGRNLADTIIPPGFRAAHLEGLRRFHETGAAPVLNQRLELSGLHRSGREFPIELTITSPIHGENGLFFGAFLRDISSRKEHDEQLQRAKDSAEQSRDRLDRELASAGLMQQLLLPSELPIHPRVQFVSYYRTSRHAGGDYYNVLPLDADRFALVVADVSGHGASAAIVMAMIRAVLHADDAPHDPEALLHHLNRHFRYLWTTAMFATAVVAVIDVAAAHAAARERGTSTAAADARRARQPAAGDERAPALLGGVRSHPGAGHAARAGRSPRVLHRWDHRPAGRR